MPVSPSEPEDRGAIARRQLEPVHAGDREEGPDAEGQRAEPRPAAESERNEPEQGIGQPPGEPRPEIDHAERRRADRDRECGRDGAHREPPGIRDEHDPTATRATPCPVLASAGYAAAATAMAPTKNSVSADGVEPRRDLDGEREQQQDAADDAREAGEPDRRRLVHPAGWSRGSDRQRSRHHYIARRYSVKRYTIADHEARGPGRVPGADRPPADQRPTGRGRASRWRRRRAGPPAGTPRSACRTARGGRSASVSWNALTMISLSLSLTTCSLQWSRFRSWTHSK